MIGNSPQTHFDFLILSLLNECENNQNVHDSQPASRMAGSSEALLCNRTPQN